MQELRAAASVLGVTSAELFDYPYGSLAEVPIGSLVSDVRRLVSEQQPDLLLVFDEAGVSGHPDHRAATESALLAAEDLPVLAWVLPDEVTSTLNAEAGTAFVGRPGDEIDMETEVDRARQLEAIACHGSRWAANAVLARRLELQGSRECFRWLRPPHALDAETAAERAAAR